MTLIKFSSASKTTASAKMPSTGLTGRATLTRFVLTSSLRLRTRTSSTALKYLCHNPGNPDPEERMPPQRGSPCGPAPQQGEGLHYQGQNQHQGRSFPLCQIPLLPPEGHRYLHLGPPRFQPPQRQAQLQVRSSVGLQCLIKRIIYLPFIRINTFFDLRLTLTLIIIYGDYKLKKYFNHLSVDLTVFN